MDRSESAEQFKAQPDLEPKLARALYQVLSEYEKKVFEQTHKTALNLRRRTHDDELISIESKPGHHHKHYVIEFTAKNTASNFKMPDLLHEAVKQLTLILMPEGISARIVPKLEGDSGKQLNDKANLYGDAELFDPVWTEEAAAQLYRNIQLTWSTT